MTTTEAEGLGGTRGRILEELAVAPLTARDLAKKLGIQESAARGHLGRMEERGLGFREPGAEAPEALALDVIVVPALQIDGRGHRIGYGAGFYDGALPRYAPPALAVGVAFTFQLIAEVPVTDGDVALGLVVTDDQVLDPER